jgi:hypothetical protein
VAARQSWRDLSTNLGTGMITEHGFASTPMDTKNFVRALAPNDIQAALSPLLSVEHRAAGTTLMAQLAKELGDLSQITTSRIQKENKGKGSLQLGWTSKPEFNAGIGPAGRDHDYVMLIAMAAPLTLLSMAHAIWTPAPSQLSKLEILRGDMQPGALDPRALAVANDASVLLYYHELSHLLEGHCGLVWDAEPALDRRAFESQADYFAGLTFVARQPVPIRESTTASWKAMATRLVPASLLLSTAFKAFSEPSDQYHFPTTRMFSYLGGGFSSIRQHCKKFKLSAPFANQQAEMAFLRPLADEFAQRLRASPLHEFAGIESTLAQDVEQLMKITVPRLKALEPKILSLWKNLAKRRR